MDPNQPHQADNFNSTSSTHTSGNMTALFAYLGILIVIPFLIGSKDDPFVKFHLKQGLVLLITEVVLWVLSSMFTGIFYYLGGWIIVKLVWLFTFVLMIIGIINVVKGREKELPLVGHFASRFNF